jgi:hypothetical protein
LLAAYHATTIELMLPGRAPLCLTPGPQVPQDVALPFVVLTAWNPASHPRPASVNEKDQARLECVLQSRRLPTVRAVGRSADGAWSEPSVAVWGLDVAEAIGLGAAFGQHAIFAVTEEGVAVLECPVGRPPADAGASA